MCYYKEYLDNIKVLETSIMSDYDSSLPPRSERQASIGNKNENKGSFFKDVLSTVRYIIVLSLVFFIVHRFFFSPVMVDGDSMEPTLSDGDYLLLNKFSEIEPFDIVVFPPPDEEEIQYIKRVIAQPGDTVEYREDILYLNGEAVEQPFLEEKKAEEISYYSSGDFSLLTLLGVEEVPAGQYFVMGDNRLNSRDSRSFGFIDEEDILGKVTLRYWPFEAFGTVE